MNAVASSRRELWLLALSQSSVWRRALKFGLTTGLLQAAVNQGDVWLHHAQTTETIVKTVASPFIGVAIVLVAAVETWVQKTLEQQTK
jgi:hypothetical protein